MDNQQSAISDVSVDEEERKRGDAPSPERELECNGEVEPAGLSDGSSDGRFRFRHSSTYHLVDLVAPCSLRTSGSGLNEARTAKLEGS